MKAAAFGDNHSINLLETDAPEIPPGWVRVAVGSVGICGSDLHMLHGMMGDRRGITPGHEVAGVVESVGDNVSVATGTRVAVEPIHGCGNCHHCLGGYPQRCKQMMLFGLTTNGGMADLVCVPEHCLHPVENDISMTMAALCEPLAVCLRALRLANMSPGARVGILGAGSVGLVAIVAARALGAAEVYITARHPHQQALANGLGATAAFADRDGAFGAIGGEHLDITVETVGGTADTLVDATQLTRSGGTIAMLGAFDGSPALPAFQFLGKELRLVGSSCYGHEGSESDFASAVRMAGDYQSDLLNLVTHTYKLDEAAEAFATAKDKRTGSIKVHITP